MVKKFLSFLLNNKTFIFLFLIFFLFSQNVFSHGLNVRYELPIPIYLYLIFSSLVIVITIFFVKFVKFSKSIKMSAKIPEARRSQYNYSFIQNFSLLIFIFLIISGLLGSQESLKNIINVFFWVWIWVGVAYLSIIFGNIWADINPWNKLYSLFLYYFRSKIKKYRRHSKVEVEIIGLIILVLFMWFAMVSPYREVPQLLSFLFIMYFFITFIGMIFYGRNRWFSYAEIFNIYFGMLGRLSIFSRSNKNLIKNFRMPFSGVNKGSGSFFSALFIVFAVSSISYDGILETAFWYNIKNFLISVSYIQDFFRALGLNYNTLNVLLDSLGFFIVLIIFCSLFLLTCFRSKNNILKLSSKNLFIAFSPALIPIAAAYLIAHYFSFLLIAGQLIFILISDPLGLGWNLFGTANHQINVYILNVKLGWGIILASVVIGHIFSVIISHKIAYEITNNIKEGFQVHLPFSIFMVFYTVFSLYILAQPIVH